MYVLSSFVALILQILPPVGGMPPPFTKVPPSVLYVVSGEDARMVWNYSVSDRNTEFSSYSPTWYYYPDTTKIQLAYEYKRSNPKWQWTVAPTCPDRLKGRISKESTATLVISNVTTADNGTYECGLMLSQGLYKSSKTELFVTVPPRFLINPPSSIVVSESSYLALSCSASGSPTPDITWVKLQDNSTLIKRNGIANLVIQGIRRDQSGTYECRASNNPNEVPISARTLVVVQYSPSITTAPKATEVTQGNQIYLTCRASGNPVPIISWSKGGNIKAGSSTSGNTLVIQDEAKSDAGKYICRARNVFGSIPRIAVASAYVTVKYQPTMLSRSQDQIINEASPLRLSCTADGYPAPNITWTKSPGTIRPSVITGNQYSIQSAKKTDAGTYTCTASNGIGRKAVIKIQVTVQYRPEIDASKSTKTLDSWKGKQLTLRCSFTGYPAPLISWYKLSGSKVTSPHKRTTSKDGTFLSEMNMTTTTPEDYGKYKCLAVSVIGTDEHYIAVKQLFTPYKPEQSHVISDSKGSRVTIFWCAPGVKGGTPVIDYKVEIDSNPPREMITKSTFAELKGLKENTKYTVKVYARNKAGYGDPVKRVIVTGKDENHSTFVIASLSTILAISLLANALFVFTIIKSQREERAGKQRLAKRYKDTSYENKTDVEMEDRADEERDPPTNTYTRDPDIPIETSSETAEENTSHYQSLSSATRSPVEAQPPRLYESLTTMADKPQQSEYQSLRLNSGSSPTEVEAKKPQQSEYASLQINRGSNPKDAEGETET